MKKVNGKAEGKLKFKKFLVAKVSNPHVITGGNAGGDDPIETFPTQKPL